MSLIRQVDEGKRANTTLSIRAPPQSSLPCNTAASERRRVFKDHEQPIQRKKRNTCCWAKKSWGRGWIRRSFSPRSSSQGCNENWSRGGRRKRAGFWVAEICKPGQMRITRFRFGCWVLYVAGALTADVKPAPILVGTLRPGSNRPILVGSSKC